MLILIVEDDTDVADTYADALQSAGYMCESVANGNEASDRLSGTTYDLVLLDIELPGKSGLELLSDIRTRNPAQSVLLITGRGELHDRVQGLDLGADDYLVKPIQLPELLARVRAALRRAQGGKSLILRIADLHIDIANRRVTRNARELELTNREFALLEYLARRSGETVAYETLARDVWKHAPKAAPINNLVAAHVSHLRDKLHQDGAPKLIHTVWGKGFCLRASDDQDNT